MGTCPLHPAITAVNDRIPVEGETVIGPGALISGTDVGAQCFAEWVASAIGVYGDCADAGIAEAGEDHAQQARAVHAAQR